MSKNLALFDFDGTITTKDSFLEFIKFYQGKRRFYKGLAVLSPLLLLYKLKIIPNWKAKEMVLTYFFKGERLSVFKSKCDDFANRLIPSLVRSKALQRIKDHKQNGDRVIVVTASAENWLECWCKSLEVELIGTQLEVRQGLLTGKLSSKNCYGPEKLRRVLGFTDLKEYNKIFVYGDSRGDKEILDIATDPHYRYF